MTFKKGHKPPKPWKKGQSGNPGGRPKILKEVQALARTYTEAAIETLAEIMQNKNHAASARTKAAEVLLDRAWGRPSQAVEVTSRTPPEEQWRAARDDLIGLLSGCAARAKEDSVAEQLEH